MKTRLSRACVSILLTLASAHAVQAQESLDRVSELLHQESAGGALRASLSLVADSLVLAAEPTAQGSLIEDDEAFFQPRLSAFLDVEIGRHFLLHGQMRADRGFDPGSAPGGQVRLDEWYLQWNVLGDDRLKIRAGKFATAFGSWVNRHLSWDNPLVTAPALYEDMLPVTRNMAPAGPAGQAGRRNQPDNKRTWAPIIWGPSYASGVSLFGKLQAFSYALEIKNAALASGPDAWDALNNGLQTGPTWTGRLGWQPAPEWTLGTSFSHGPYLQDMARFSLPAGSSVNDFDQTTWGLDAGYAHGRWQVWSELAHATFAIPNVGDVRALSGYVEARYKVTAQLWTALRWNQAWYGDVPGAGTSWDRQSWRMDAALGWRFSTHLQAKLQYSLAGKQGPDAEGNHLVAGMVTLRF